MLHLSLNLLDLCTSLVALAVTVATYLNTMAQAMTAVAHLPKAAPRHCTYSKLHKLAARRACTGRSSRSQRNSSVNGEHNETAETSNQSQEATASQQQERFVSVSDLLAEVSGWIIEPAADVAANLLVN